MAEENVPDERNPLFVETTKSIGRTIRVMAEIAIPTVSQVELAKVAEGGAAEGSTGGGVVTL